ncbi:GTPase [Vibrio alginolyticus]|uniref:GTPase n=1 Tax=Vibrio alginolyticus TaxID=663 RepID=UPI00215B9215|nr:GTPase [Vibrio alginolyticus]MCR9504334.1 50S ribosome-binding GTPase [Vibrio alginolyticus]
MINLSSFKNETSRIHKKVLDVVQSIEPSYTEQITGMFDDKEVVLKLALVGQYNAGKSSILKALTGDDEIKIDSNICTDEVTAYNWNRIQVLDTPGVHAGRSDHDQTTYTAIDEADLLIFVITNELFDDVIGKHFRQLAFERHKAKEILLVVNKMARDSGTAETKISSLLPVLEPMLPEDFNTTFIDAECYLDALEEDDEQDREDLFEESNFEALVTSINSFVEQKGFLGKLTTPLSSMQSTVRKLREEKSVSNPEEKLLIELLHRKLSILREGELRLKRKMTEMLNSTLYEVSGFGDDLAEMICESSTEDAVKAKSDEAETRCKFVVDKLSEDFVTTVRSHVEQVTSELEQLEKSQLAKALNDAIDQISSGHVADNITHIGDQIKISDYESGANDRYAKLSSWAQKGLNFTSESAKGVNATANNLGSAAGVSGSSLHNGVKIVGKFFGVKFKPWQAVNIAKNIGNVARYLGPAMAVIGVGLQIYDDLKQEEQRTTMRDARADIRREFRKIAKDLEQQFQERILHTVNDIHCEETQQTQSTLDEITTGNFQVCQQLTELSELEKELGNLIVKIQQSV